MKNQNVKEVRRTLRSYRDRQGRRTKENPAIEEFRNMAYGDATTEEIQFEGNTIEVYALEDMSEQDKLYLDAEGNLYIWHQDEYLTDQACRIVWEPEPSVRRATETEVLVWFVQNFANSGTMQRICRSHLREALGL